MTNAPKQQGGQLIVTAAQITDPASDLWLVTGPYWDDGTDEAALVAFSAMIDGEQDALSHVRELVSGSPGCKLQIYRREAAARV